MTEASEFQSLLERASAGDEAAMAELVRRYEPAVRIVARARISERLRPYIDSVDVTQSVHRSLLAGLKEDRFDIASPEKLVGLAVVMVRWKIAKHWRKLRRQQRDSHNDDNQPVRPIADHESVSAAVDAQDQFDFLAADLSDIDRQIIELRLIGHSTAEAARTLNLDPAVVRVRLSRLRSRLRDRLDRTR